MSEIKKWLQFEIHAELKGSSFTHCFNDSWRSEALKRALVI